MKKKLKRLAIIPARKGSKRIPNKNLINFHGKPIIEYSISCAIESNLFDKIHVSTNCDKIRIIIEQNNLEFDFFRPEKLCTDTSKLIDVLFYVLSKFNEQNCYFDEVWLIMACAPLIESTDLINASMMFHKEQNINGLMASAKFPTPIEWAYKLSDENKLIPIKKSSLQKNSQSFNTYFYDAGLFYAYKSKDILNFKNINFNNYFSPFLINPIKAIDIDTIEDLNIAKEIFNYRKS